MPAKPERIIIDTNIWVSFLITKSHLAFDNILFSKQVVILFNEELLDEFITVVRRPKLKKYFSEKDILAIIESINGYAVFVQTKTVVTECRDPKDNFLLSLSMDGKADYLITGDKDLLDLKKYGKTEIITISNYIATKEAYYHFPLK